MRACIPNRHGVPAASAVLLALALAGCTAARTLPFQALSNAALSSGRPPYGYADSQVDAWKYAIIYTDSDKERAQSYLELRAAQIARDAGFPYFEFDNKIAGAVLRGAVHFGRKQFDQPLMRGAVQNPIDYIYAIRPDRVFQYFTAIGQISLLTAEQARGNHRAIEAAPLLARMAAPAKS
jgi:hypothetical protein